MPIGLGIGLAITRGGTPGFSLTAPVLAFASATDPDSDNTQDLEADFFEDIETKVVRLVGTFGSATVSEPYDVDASNTIDATEAGNLAAAFTTGAIDDGVCSFKCRIEDGSGNALSDWSNTVSKTIDATAPTITSSATANNAENSVLAHSLTANESVTWGLNGGADAARFEISGSTLRWLSNGTKDYEAPDDAGANNVYNVTVRATDTAGNTTDQNIAITVTDVSEGPSAEASQYLDRATGMDSTHDDAFIALIDGLVADGIWSKLDALWIGATDTEAHSLLNLKSTSYPLVKVGTVSFAADDGWTSNGSTGYFTTGLVPNAGGGLNFAQDSGSIGAYIRNNRTSDAGECAIGVRTSFSTACMSMLIPLDGGVIYHYMNNASAGASSSTVATAQGMSILSRTGASAGACYKNGSSLNTFTLSSASLPDTNFIVCGNFHFNAPERLSNDQIAAAFVASGLNATEAGNISSRINTYMAAVGADVY